MKNNELFTKVNLFLTNFRNCAEGNKVDYSEINAKTTMFFREHGITYKAMSSFIQENIQEKYFFRGPSSHHRFPNRTVAEFGMVYEGIKIYVKLELIVENDDFVAGYMSFHPREQEIQHFPLDTTGEVI